MKVLLATEGSKFSEAAIEKCCKIFEESDNTQIRIISAAEPAFVAAEPLAASAAYILEMNEAAHAKAESLVAEAEETVRKHFPDMGDDLSTKVLKASPAQAIVEEAESWGADLIVVGSHGYGFWRRAFLGSVSNAVVHHAPCSVLVVRPERSGGNN